MAIGTTNKHEPWLVVGGGASGIASAHYLAKRGLRPIVLEEASELGGRIGSCMLGEHHVDFGGKNIGRRYREFRAFTAELGEHPYEFFGINSSQVRDGRVVTFDSGRRYSGMLNLARGAKLMDVARLGRLLFSLRQNDDNGYLGSEFSARLGARLDSAPVSAYFSEAICKRIIRPMSVRMNGAEPDEIYPGNLGSNLRMVLDTFDQLTHGMGPVLREFQRRVEVRLNHRVEALVVRAGRVAGLRVRAPDGRAEELGCAGVVLAIPAARAAALLEPLAPKLAVRLNTVSYYPVCLALAEYDRAIFSPSVRALLFDETRALSNAGAYGVHALNIVRYTFSGRAARELATLDDEALLSLGESALGSVLPLESRWRERFVVRRFHYGLCAYTPYHAKFLADLNQELSGLPGLTLTGDYIAGASIEACFRAAARAVQNLAPTHAEPVAALQQSAYAL